MPPVTWPPYTDRIAPVVASISIRTSPATSVLPNLVRGRVDFVVEAYDVTNRPVTGIWSNMPVSPALISWTIRDLRPRAVVRPTVAVDFRQGIPDNADFWRVYERGSFQNMSVFAKHYSYRQPGRYLYRLSRSTFDTRRLQDGVYDLVVTASDIRGNRTTSSLRLTLANGVDGRDS